MKLVAVDYGQSWCGLAISDGFFPEPYKTVKTKTVVGELTKISPETVVVGISEGQAKRQAEQFAQKLQRVLQCLVVTTDETLTSVEARLISQDKRKEHAVAAAKILEHYLDNV